jgi:hypothetical protein
MSNASGFESSVIVCENCGKMFALAPFLLAKIGNLPDPFWVRCRWCHHTASYPESAIKRVDDTGPS